MSIYTCSTFSNVTFKVIFYSTCISRKLKLQNFSPPIKHRQSQQPHTQFSKVNLPLYIQNKCRALTFENLDQSSIVNVDSHSATSLNPSDATLSLLSLSQLPPEAHAHTHTPRALSPLSQFPLEVHAGTPNSSALSPRVIQDHASSPHSLSQYPPEAHANAHTNVHANAHPNTRLLTPSAHSSALPRLVVDHGSNTVPERAGSLGSQLSPPAAPSHASASSHR